MGKSLTIPFSQSERFAVFAHLTRNVTTRTAREQDEYSDIWESLALDEIDDAITALGREAVPTDFSTAELRQCELTKDEIGYFLKFLGQPMAGVTSRLIRPIRVRIAEARDRAGIKAVPDEGEAA